MYYKHPSDQLNYAFSLKPFQGANPEMAKFLFIGLDANYAKEIDRSPIYQPLLEYLDDGITFWSKYGVHHPFLLPGSGGMVGSTTKPLQSLASLPSTPPRFLLLSYCMSPLTAGATSSRKILIEGIFRISTPLSSKGWPSTSLSLMGWQS
jgi:hypothetical protein